MAIQKQVAMLQQGTDRWNNWRQTHPDEKIDLSGADLRNATLSAANLSAANLSLTDLSGANLNGANLGGADLHRAILRGANLRGANLSIADFEFAFRPNELSYEKWFTSADLSGADLSGANFSRADLTNANLTNANLSVANLSRADLNSTDLSGAKLSGADLSLANLSDTNLSRTNLNKAIVGWTMFGNVDLRVTKHLETILHRGPSYISTSTLSRSQGDIPEIFLRGVGLEDTFIDYIRSLTSKPIEYYTCFISYSSRDELFARRLHNDLQQEGVRCWFAPEDIDIGDKIRHRIEESIRLYDKLLLILSEHSIASSWVEYEVERALNKEPHGTPNVLYPVRIDQTVMTCSAAWAKDIKNTRHIGNFEHWTDPQQYEESFKRLLRALNTRKEEQKN